MRYSTDSTLRHHLLLDRRRRCRAPSAITNAIGALPMQFEGFNVDGTVRTHRNAAEAFQHSNLFTYNPAVIDVADATALSTAVRTTLGASKVRLTANITTAPFDLRSTDASQGSGVLPKLIDLNGFTLTMATVGPTLSAQTFTVDGTFANVWNTTLTLSGSAALQRVVRTDVLDAEGAATPFWKDVTSKASLSAVGAIDAFFISGTALSVKLSNDASVEAFKANLKGYYTGSAGTSRILVSGAALGFSKNGGTLLLDGVQIVTLDAASRIPMFYADGLRQVYAPTKGADLTQCGHYVVSNSLIYGSESDGANAFATSATIKGLIQTASSRFVRNGDTRTFATNGTLQGVSAHGGSNHVSFSSQFSLNNGQGVADTCVASATDYTWMVSCSVTGGNTTSCNYEFGGAAASASRTAYLDSCPSLSPPVAGDLRINANGVVYTNGCVLSVAGGGTTAPYSPGNI